MEHFLTINILFSSAFSLLFGLAFLLAGKNRKMRAAFAEVYHWTYASLFLSAAGLGASYWETGSNLFLIAFAFYSLCLAFYLFEKISVPRAAFFRPIAFAGSYAGLATSVALFAFSGGALPSIANWFWPSIAAMVVSAAIFREKASKMKA